MAEDHGESVGPRLVGRRHRLIDERGLRAFDRMLWNARTRHSLSLTDPSRNC
jgi:hypothetical protein